MRLYEFVIHNETGQDRYFISCTNERAALQAARRLASHCMVKVLCEGELVGEVEHTNWKWNMRRLLQNPHFRRQP